MTEKFPKKKYQKISNFYYDYISNLNSEMNLIDINQLNKITEQIIIAIKKKRNIFVCGNGGSAAIANHLLADYAKYIKTKNDIKIKVISLSSNIEMITAISNDINYESIFSYQLNNYALKNDVLISISSSGNSKNILDVIKTAKKLGVKTISFLGFGGGEAKRLSDFSLSISQKNYGMSEDSAHIFMHTICQFIKQKISSKNIKNITF